MLFKYIVEITMQIFMDKILSIKYRLRKFWCFVIFAIGCCDGIIFNQALS